MPFWRRRWFCALILIAVVLIAFSPVAHFRFIDWDDRLALADNPDLTPVAWKKIAGYWIHPHLDLYAPLSYTVWAVVAWMEQVFTHGSALSPGPFHLVNLALHIATTIAVFFLLCRLKIPPLPALLGALVFALHPLQIEAVAWVASFNTLLSAFFLVLALWTYVHAAQTDFACQRRAGVGWFVISCALLALALFAKPMAAAGPVLAAVIEAMILRRPLRRWVTPVLVWTFLVIPFVLIGKLSQSTYVATQIPIWLHPLVAMDSFAFYLGKIFWPAHLSIDYQRNPAQLLASGGIWVTWMLPAAVVLVAWLASRRYKNAGWMLAGLALIFAATLPTSGIVGFAFQRYSTVADRYMYLGMLGVSVGLAGVFSSWTPRGVVIAGVVLAAAMMFRDACRLLEWHDSLSLTTAAENPRDDCAPEHRIRAFALARLGDMPQAIRQYQLAIHYDPTDANTCYDFANLLYRIGQADASLGLYQRAIELRPTLASFHHNFAVALMAAGQRDRAGMEFRRAVSLDPASDQARRDYAKWMMMRRQQR